MHMEEIRRQIPVLPGEATELFDEALQRMRVLDTYYRWTLDRVGEYVGQRVLDAGCGIGNFVALLEPLCHALLDLELYLVR